MLLWLLHARYGQPRFLTCCSSAPLIVASVFSTPAARFRQCAPNPGVVRFAIHAVRLLCTVHPPPRCMLFMLMEYCTGGTLHARLTNGKRKPTPTQVFDWILQVRWGGGLGCLCARPTPASPLAWG
jgi:hypothetical protein